MKILTLAEIMKIVELEINIAKLDTEYAIVLDADMGGDEYALNEICNDIFDAINTNCQEINSIRGN